MRWRRRDNGDFDAAEAARIAMYDDVTGLASRYLFFDRLGLALARTQRRNSRAAVLLLDLDGFEKVEERTGRGTAEESLREVSDRLMTVIRPGDSAARVATASSPSCARRSRARAMRSRSPSDWRRRWRSRSSWRRLRSTSRPASASRWRV